MKSIRLLTAAMLLTTVTVASASDHERAFRRSSPNVLVIMSEESGDEQSIYEFEDAERMKRHLCKREEETKATKAQATMLFMESQRTGYQSAKAPLLLFTQKQNKFTFGIGGFINLRSSYDYNGIVENIDFVTADIPTPGNYATKQQFMMDASTSRVYIKAIANTRALGKVEVFADMDFRGGTSYTEGDGVTVNYTPRVRCAYVSFLGITLGRDITTFCDLAAAPRTVDFQGPNAYSFNYATLLRYQYSCCNDRLGMAIALEQPNVSATYDDNFSSIPQRMPDIPMYIEYKMGRKREHHFRVSGVLRNMYYYNDNSQENVSLFGWGVKASGNLKPFEWLGLCFNGTYGEGITPYIQDLNGLGLDFTPDPTNLNSAQTMPMFAWQAAATIYLTEKLSGTGGYSTAQVQKHNGYYTGSQYRRGEYAFGNIFYDVTPRFTVAAEYLYGQRKNMTCGCNTAHRASLMAQFNF